MLVDSTWDFARDILWWNKSLSEEEIMVTKSFIRERYERIPAKKFKYRALKHHKHICSLVLIAKKQEGESIAHPCIWFNDLYTDGLAGMSKADTVEPNKISNL